MIARKFGDWNSPNPIPHTAIRAMIPSWLGPAGNVAIKASPVDRITNPVPPRIAGLYRSESGPAIGAMIAVKTGQGVSSTPVSTALRPKLV